MSGHADPLSRPLRLPCGAVLDNRLAKAAMTEGIADAGNRATAAHARLYERWARGGAGLNISGNVMVDRDHLERPGNVVIDSAEVSPALRAWARAGTRSSGHLWMQLGHAGRQTPRSVNPRPKGASAVPLRLAGQFGTVEPYSHAEIVRLVGHFARAARVAREAGFSGVQVHAAHGFLISQFLSSHLNRRNDRWGGSLANRARLLLEVIGAVRDTVGPGFPVSVKLNSTDFQRGGFTFEECLQVVRWLNAAGVDLLEVTGGNYERPAMVGHERTSGGAVDAPSERTRGREAYFLDYAQRIRAIARMPVMVTGGFRTRAFMAAALDRGELDLVGLARPLIADPDLPAKLLSGRSVQAPSVERSLVPASRLLGPKSPLALVRLINIQGQQGWFYHQLRRLAAGREPAPRLGVLGGMASHLFNERRAALAVRAFRTARPPRAWRLKEKVRGQ